MKAGAKSGGFSNSVDHAAAGYILPVIMAHGQANAELVTDGEPSVTSNHEAPILFDPAQVTSKANRSNPKPGDPSHTIHQGAAPLLVRMREGKAGGGKGPLISEDKSLTLATANDQTLFAIHPHVIGRAPNAGPQGKEYFDDGSAYCMDSMGAPQSIAFAQNQRNEVREMEVIGSLAAEPGMKQTTYIRTSMQVRRLMPIETERLQGFPDNHTLVPFGGKPAKDTPRYKGVGNSWAVPVVKWIGERIQTVDTP